ncbi:ACP S-malonyltransferase [Shewanella sp. FYR11-62]|uniref:[acyl-carrier-protein] S-malonyltransferase n=1 Tax=Shewanella subflava TaxID=2986476 RepID=A0ABT3ICY7_9GAMM|nr:ACP S-malonyltransferase [Shewanella subflava]MCW3173907.1 ACP S-malonyltransferase [Shewanella subflava]
MSQVDHNQLANKVNISKQRVLVVAPGRGCYNKDELGYLQRFHTDKKDFIASIDTYRKSLNQQGITQLDGQAKYSFKLHTTGENASALIYACAMSDFKDIDREQYEIVAVTGNSMGWYIALALAGSLNEQGAIEVINTMGSMMADGLIGGQLIYPEMDEHWLQDCTKTMIIDDVIAKVNNSEGCELFSSIYLGGYRVLAGNEAGLKLAEILLPNIDGRYPMRLYNHAAFHSPLLQQISNKAKALLPQELFHQPQIPMIDGEGNIWTQYSTDLQKLHEYTLVEQVLAPYDFTVAIAVGIKEFAPDKVIILGPGNTLGGPVAQAIINVQGFDWRNKADFISVQGILPRLLAMGIKTQRELVIKY